MQKFLFSFVTCLFPFLTIFAQVNFEKGYLIYNSDTKINCFIKNSDWKNNPTEFYYKLSENSEIKMANIETVKEFGVIDEYKYKRFVVDIDRSSDHTNNLSIHKQPKFNKEKLFLKVLFEGKANLYSYESTNLRRYFFSLENKTIEQLVSKKYVVRKNKAVMNNYIGNNNYFRQQLFNKLKCADFTSERFKHIKYQEKALVNLFIDFNNCGKSDNNLIEKKKNNNFKLNIRPGINSSSLSVIDIETGTDPIDFGNMINFRLGLEMEYIFPFNKNKWAMIVEPSFNYFKSEGLYFNNNVIADIKSLDIPIGVRHYFFLKKDSKLFVNTSYLTSIGINSIIDFENEFRRDLNASRLSGNMVFGVGYRYKKYILELKYDTRRNLFSTQRLWHSDYERTTLIIGYNLF